MNRKRLEGNDSGIVSILVTIIFMVVIGLIIMGFAESSRNQNRQTIDNQLSTGSYYAAQSGINEILTNLKDGTGTFTDIQKSCCPLSLCGAGALGFNSTDSSTITCYSYNRIPGNLVYGNVSTSQPTIAHIVPVDSSGNSYTGDYKLTFTWNDNSGNSSSNCDYSFSQTYTKDNYVNVKKCSPGVLRLDLSIDPSSCTGASANNMRDCLKNNAETIFLTPTNSSTTQTIFPVFSGQINPLILNGVSTGSSNSVSITCKSSPACSYINMRAIYSSSIVKIGITDLSDHPLAFADGQAQIDVTAKTQNVVRRLVATASLTNNSSNVPGFAIQSTDSICKLLVIDNTKGKLSGGVSDLYTSSDPSGLGTSIDSCWSGYL